MKFINKGDLMNIKTVSILIIMIGLIFGALYQSLVASEVAFSNTANYLMSCEKVNSNPNIKRCENSEVVCYVPAHTESIFCIKR